MPGRTYQNGEGVIVRLRASLAVEFGSGWYQAPFSPICQPLPDELLQAINYPLEWKGAKWAPNVRKLGGLIYRDKVPVYIG
jgi:hypothetical protein